MEKRTTAYWYWRTILIVVDGFLQITINAIVVLYYLYYGINNTFSYLRIKHGSKKYIKGIIYVRLFRQLWIKNVLKMLVPHRYCGKPFRRKFGILKKKQTIENTNLRAVFTATFANTFAGFRQREIPLIRKSPGRAVISRVRQRGPATALDTFDPAGEFRRVFRVFLPAADR